MEKIFVVSCQALKEEPLYGDDTMVKMAKAALMGGADWIRTSQMDNIIKLKKNLTVPIIGLIKIKYPDSEIHISPSLKELKSLIESRVDIIAIDATSRNRPHGETLKQLVKYFKNHKHSNQKLMADCSKPSEAIEAQQLGFDLVSTTLVGYTKETQGQNIVANDFAILKNFRSSTTLPLAAEGRIWTPEQARQAFACQADIVVVGGAITRPQLITKRFAEAINK